MGEVKRLAILWAPWRIKYIESPRTKACILCIGEEVARDRELLVVHRGFKSFIIMNRYPYNTGHLMVAPYRHVGDLLELTGDELLDLVRNVNLSVRLLKETLKPEGFNIGINIGRVAGAGIEDHLHVHVLPRWIGDTNFMPTIAQVKVMPELLESTYDRLKASLLKILEEGAS
ncbi:MAG: HIT domain-containing protein [Candidatus Nezhaarchaeales archaeon]|nr:MAG: HIT family hydrolase [Candidatus Nezhaarchaeota archaeon WYZ-LMO8]TDA36498.1 MAG: HIT family hydrolase [Candidatus Nezhaarchaeota archaeon WYZ-LMO7]